MKITIETDSLAEATQILDILKSLDLQGDVKVSRQLPLQKGDKSLQPGELFGLWAKKPRNMEDLRKNAWRAGKS
jgi:hypothetical protein